MWALDFMIDNKTYFPTRNMTLLHDNSRNRNEREFFHRNEIAHIITVIMEKYPEIDNIEAGPVAD